MSEILSNNDNRVSTNINELISWCQHHDFKINLNSEIIALLLSIASTQKDSNTELSENEIFYLINFVSKFYSNNEASKGKGHINNIINNLVEQKIINRFSFDDIDATSIYRLTPLGSSITDYYLRQREFSQLALSLQLSIVADEMDRAVSYSKTDGDINVWRNKIYGPLKYSIADIFDLIDYRQRELDEEQNRIKQEISDLLRKDWHESIHLCEQLLSNTGNTLSELQSTLSVTGDNLQKELSTVSENLSFKKDKVLELEDSLEKTQFLDFIDIIEELIAKLQNKLDVILSWGNKSIDLWTGFDKHIHKFIRNVIDLDKNRVFSQRLRKSIDSYLENPWYLFYTNAEPFLDMREDNSQLIEAEVLDEYSSELVYEDFNNADEKIRSYVQSIINPYYENNENLNIQEILQTLLQNTEEIHHFNVTKIFIEQAMNLGIASKNILGIYPEWQPITKKGAEVQAHIIDSYK